MIQNFQTHAKCAKIRNFILDTHVNLPVPKDKRYVPCMWGLSIVHVLLSYEGIDGYKC